MKWMLSILALLMSINTVFSQNNSTNSIGWRDGVLTSYCEEYDLMIQDNKQWILPWNATRSLVRYTLIKDGYKIEETDSTISWQAESFLKFEIQFTKDSKIKNVGMVIIVSAISGVKIADALYKKLESIHRKSGEYRKTNDSGTSFVWHNTNCNKSIVSMLYSSIVNSDKYLITLYSSQLQ
jgi:hypothetical protein